ncbi:hypothetical protein CRENBAI_014122 [Crenichthys baileyi]|uniref:Uncharacterized protein n=1 Tax=Crenichthys baileyi TaxID=28760 RepID=A0AAV9RAH0_9TELE
MVSCLQSCAQDCSAVCAGFPAPVLRVCFVDLSETPPCEIYCSLLLLEPASWTQRLSPLTFCSPACPPSNTDRSTQNLWKGYLRKG